jgi:Tol biopolymer transport system component
VWSPDGKRIAFAAADPSVTQRPAPANGIVFASFSLTHPFLQDVWLIDRDGANLHRLSELAESQPSLSWSPDGSTVYVMGGSGLWKIDVATGDRQQIGVGVQQGSILLLDSR